eukprot:1524270-Prymnesium_polylepis.1
MAQRRTSASSGSYALSASIAASAFDSCQTPTMALSTRMVRMTSGSTCAVRIWRQRKGESSGRSHGGKTRRCLRRAPSRGCARSRPPR